MEQKIVTKMMREFLFSIGSFVETFDIFKIMCAYEYTSITLIKLISGLIKIIMYNVINTFVQ